jgi:ubiquinone/menaquinone biosynthesis C-methylase UbiE
MDRPFEYYEYLNRRSRLSLIFRSFFIQDFVKCFSGKILDIGSGAGEFSLAYPASFGVEINPYLAAYGQQKGLKISLASIFSLPFSDREFDGVLISNVLEHLAEPQTAFGESARVLKPGGRLMVTVPFLAGFRRDRTHRTFLKESDLMRFSSEYHLHPLRIYSYPPCGSFLGNVLTFFELRAIFMK